MTNQEAMTMPIGRRWFQIHLSTVVVLVFAAGGLIGLNLRPEAADIVTEQNTCKRYYHVLRRGWPLQSVSQVFYDHTESQEYYDIESPIHPGIEIGPKDNAPVVKLAKSYRGSVCLAVDIVPQITAPDGERITYLWTVIDPPTLILPATQATQSSLRFKLSAPRNFELNLTVTDSRGRSGSAQTRLTGDFSQPIPRTMRTVELREPFKFTWRRRELIVDAAVFCVILFSVAVVCEWRIRWRQRVLH